MKPAARQIQEQQERIFKPENRAQRLYPMVVESDEGKAVVLIVMSKDRIKLHFPLSIGGAFYVSFTFFKAAAMATVVRIFPKLFVRKD